SGSNDEDGSDGGTPRAGPTLRVLKEAMHAAAEASAASAASAALREKLRLQQLRQGGLEQEVAALRSGLERRVQGLEQHTSQRACEVEGRLRGVEGRLRGVEAAAQRPDSGGDALLLQQLQARVARLERRQGAMQGHAVTELSAATEGRGNDVAEPPLPHVFRNQQEEERQDQEAQRQQEPKSDTVNNAAQEKTATRGVAAVAAATSPAAAGSLDARRLRLDIDALRLDLVSCIVEIEKVMDQQQRLGSRVHGCMSALQQHQTEVSGLSEQQKASIESHMARLERQQSAATARQEKQLAAALDVLQAKIVSEVRRVHELREDTVVRADQQRLGEVATAQKQLRDELRIAVERQHEEVKLALEQISETERRLERDVVSQLQTETARQLDAARQTQDAATDATQRLVQETQDDLRRMQNSLKDGAVLTQERFRRLEASLETRLADEARRLKTFTSDATLRLQRQVEDEVRRLVHITEQESLASMQQEMQRVDVAVRALEEEQRALREGMLAVTAPSRTLASLDHRMTVLQEDVRGAYAQLERVQSAGSLALPQQLLARQQRILQEDLLEVKTRLRRCEACCGDGHAESRHPEVSASHSSRDRRFPRISETPPTTPRLDAMTSAAGKLGPAAGADAGAAQGLVLPRRLNHSRLTDGTRDGCSSGAASYDPLAGVFD
ncbi:putative plectin-like protein, partial [Trypanosoma conorhini]